MNKKAADSATALKKIKSGRATINEIRKKFDLKELNDEEANVLLSIQGNHISVDSRKIRVIK